MAIGAGPALPFAERVLNLFWGHAMSMANKAAGRLDGLVGGRIRARREQVGLTQHEVAVELGISHQQIRKYEVGANRISAARLKEIADVLEVPIGYFFDRTDTAVTPAVASLHPSRDEFVLIAQQRDLLNAFVRIKSVETRRRLLDLAKAMADEGCLEADGKEEQSLDDEPSEDR